MEGDPPRRPGSVRAVVLPSPRVPDRPAAAPGRAQHFGWSIDGATPTTTLCGVSGRLCILDPPTMAQLAPSTVCQPCDTARWAPWGGLDEVRRLHREAVDARCG